ncbi:hypothetical protein M998_1237 [Providencia heimbachae ATCC 35613]|uniref:Uncharacterized protein n=1 Tax=Providencia heimbachae ATCC 35613 TaxID=1354272 RepID=A0A1B7JYU6_9GAMM|nr:hypothetical protein M998_1237 [Providencia heimbachae ATCC 35613]
MTGGDWFLPAPAFFVIVFGIYVFELKKVVKNEEGQMNGETITSHR